jgi:urea transporter
MNNPVTGLAILVAMFVVKSWLGFAGALGLVASAGFIGGWKVPSFALGFNFITLIFLVAALNVANGRIGGLIVPADAQVTAGSVSSTLRSAPDAASANNIEGVANALFRGIGQLFFANSLASGIVIVVGLAVCSRIAAIFAVLGSITGMLTGLALGANGVAIYNGLCGFNSFDAALPIGGVFFVLTWRSGVLAIACAALAALLFGALASLFTPWGLPALTLPFCFATLASRTGRRSSTPSRSRTSPRPRSALTRVRGAPSEGERPVAVRA